MTDALSQYRALLAKVDSLSEEIRGRHPHAFACRRGCHGCCKPGLTVNALEAEHIRAGLQPALIEELRALEAADPHQGFRCAFLQENGACGIYELRPIVCRSHGLPMQLKDLGEAAGEEAVFRDVCSLNFADQDISSLPEGDLLNLDTLNTVLATLNRFHGEGLERRELSISGLLASL